MRCFLTLLFVCALSLGASERREVAKPFRYQAAVNTSIAPKMDQWSTSFKPTENVHSLWMEAFVDIPESSGKRFELDFTRINGNAVVFINDQRIGERLGPYGAIEITGAVKPGRNTVRLFVTRGYTDVSRTFEKDLLRYTARGPRSVWGEIPMKNWALGINAPLYLVSYPATAGITDAWAETSFRRKELALHVELANDARTPVIIEGEIFDADGKSVLTIAPLNVVPKSDKATFTLRKKWATPRLWELDAPYVYRARVQVRVGGKVIDAQEFNFGFREVWTEGRHMMLNGHVQRLRLDWAQNGYTSANGMTLLKLLRRNAVYFQSNPTGWWRAWDEVYYFSPAELDLMDQNGVGVFLPVPSANFGREKFFDDPEYLRQYRAELEGFIRRYRNHPSILAWCISMIAFCPRDGISPATIGQRTDYPHSQAKVLNFVTTLAHEIDPTRLAYGHAEGNTGDIASGNTYPNWTPLQEVGDYGEMFVRKGDMPWWACEYGIYDGSFYKGKQFLPTEYGAITLGPESYKLESDALRAKLIEIGIKNEGHGGNLPEYLSILPVYWRIQRDFYSATNRAWRSDGILAWHYFDFNVGFGAPPGGPMRWQNRYKNLPVPLTERPAWANPAYDNNRAFMDNLLVYVGGYPRHTDKTHAFRSGEKFTKNLVAVWDGPGEMVLKGEIALHMAGRDVETKKIELKLASGDTKEIPIVFTAPKVHTRTPAEIVFKDGGRTDSFAVEFFPPVEKLELSVLLYDPAGRSGWVRDIVKDVKDFTPGNRLKPGEILVVGREALKIGEDLPCTASELDAGAKLVILEQLPEVWEAMGLRSIEPATRVVFANSPLLPRQPEDLRFWRGTPDLTPEFKHARPYDVTIAPKGSNRNTVASAVLEIPVAAGFSPLAVCEFDLNYSPLLQFCSGKGMILFSSFDFSGRTPEDPAAAQMAQSLLNIAAKDVAAQRLLYAFPEAQKELAATRLDFAPGAFDAAPAKSVVVLAGNDQVPAGNLEAFTAAGGRVVLLNKGTPEKQISHAVLGGAFAPNLCRWRDALNVRLLANGDVYDRADGVVSLQVVPSMLSSRYADDPQKKEAVALSVIRLRQLLSQVITKEGVQPGAEVTARLLKIRRGLGFKELDNWFVYGPFKGKSLKAAENLNLAYPGETQALAGDLNPNTTYDNGLGRKLDFRRTALAEAGGFVNLGQALNADSADSVGYAIKWIEAKTDHKAMLRLGADYFFFLYVNGKLVYDQSRGHAAPKPNAFHAKINLKKGPNILVLKVMAGSKGFGFWANLSEPGIDYTQADKAASAELLYDPEIKLRSPYEYFYW